MKKQPELPELIRDMEILQSLNRTQSAMDEVVNAQDLNETQDMSDGTSN